MKLIIKKEIFEKFPELQIAVIVAKDVNNRSEESEVLKLISEQEKIIREKYDTETLSQIPKIDSWRKAYQAFGAKPKKNKCSVENLYRMVLQGNSLRHINKMVDIYNYVSLKHMIPIGGDDIDKINGNINLGIAKGDEDFIELNSSEVKHPKEDEVVYSDDKEVLCRRWNWRECDKSKMTESTKNVCLVVEGLPPVTKEELEQITKELSGLVEQYCSGKTTSFILDKGSSEAEF